MAAANRRRRETGKSQSKWSACSESPILFRATVFLALMPRLHGNVSAALRRNNHQSWQILLPDSPAKYRRKTRHKIDVCPPLSEQETGYATPEPTAFRVSLVQTSKMISHPSCSLFVPLELLSARRR